MANIKFVKQDQEVIAADCQSQAKAIQNGIELSITSGQDDELWGYGQCGTCIVEVVEPGKSFASHRRETRN